MWQNSSRYIPPTPPILQDSDSLRPFHWFDSVVMTLGWGGRGWYFLMTEQAIESFFQWGLDFQLYSL